MISDTIERISILTGVPVEDLTDMEYYCLNFDSPQITRCVYFALMTSGAFVPGTCRSDEELYNGKMEYFIRFETAESFLSGLIAYDKMPDHVTNGKSGYGELNDV
jgi:hypothetical protein